jgi:hypothetical protein
MGAFQFSGFSFGTVGANGGGARPMGAPPINSFIVWRGNKVHSNGGFSLASDVDMTPGDFHEEPEAAAQPFTSEVLLDYIMQPLVELYGGCMVVLKVSSRPRCYSRATRCTTPRCRSREVAGSPRSVACCCVATLSRTRLCREYRPS